MTDEPKDKPRWMGLIFENQSRPRPSDGLISPPAPSRLKQALLDAALSKPGVTIISNVIGTADASCSCESWLEHWEKYADRKAGLCPVVLCAERATCGAHVTKAGDSTVYILPLCSGHNKSGEPLKVPSDYPFVSANAGETCRPTLLPPLPRRR